MQNTQEGVRPANGSAGQKPEPTNGLEAEAPKRNAEEDRKTIKLQNTPIRTFRNIHKATS